MPRRFLSILLLTLIASSAQGENWPGFRGPTGQGISSEKGLPTKWNAGENITWSVPIPGEGWSSPIVWGDRVFVTTATEDGESCRVIALDRKDGKTLWNVEVFRQKKLRKEGRNSYATPTPVTDGVHVYAVFNDGGIAALTMEGKPAWINRDVHYYSQHGLGGSPILYKDKLIMAFDGSSPGPDKFVGWQKPWDQSFLLALDKLTGKELWRGKRGLSRIAHTTPSIVTLDGVDELISSAGDVIQGFDPNTGVRRWSVPAEGEGVVPSPVLGDGLVFAASGFGNPRLRAVKLERAGDSSTRDVVWEMKRNVPMMPSALFVKPHLFLISEKGLAQCIEAMTGKVKWEERIGNSFLASPIYADGRVYFLAEDGETTVIEAKDEFTVVSRNSLKGPCQASIAVSQGQLFIRSRDRLYCIGKKAAVDTKKWPADIEDALVRAGQNRPEMEKALDTAPTEERPGMVFLLANMPDSDLRSLKADFLLENVALAYRARREVPWGKNIPEAIFLDNVLAYANVDESRDPWRKEFFELCMPLIKNCQTPSEAAELLNRTVFPTLKVSYSTKRKKPHQSPRESIASGKASCTGLSIILSDACRSVAIPARLVGTPLWADKSGNHTWVEIWDHRWRFTGACEPDPKGLDRGWFVGNAGQAKKDEPLHAIYAASFRRNLLSFPLVWAPDRKDVYAENVTDRYTQQNHINKEKRTSLTSQQQKDIEKEAIAYFTAPTAEQAKWRFDAKFDQLLAGDDQETRAAVWAAYREAPIHAALKKDFDNNQVRNGEYLSPYKVREVGKRPDQGWPLVIAMHGGGNAPKELNDSQWNGMLKHYRDHPEVTGYKYLSLRAPNDTWNGFYDDYVPPLIINLIRQFSLFGEVDPDKVFLIGYSHGGYGAFFIGPKIPDRFAAIHSSAAAPTDGTISPLSLRNTRFTYMIGETDTAYGRRERCEKFDREIQKLQSANKGEFPVHMEFKPGFAHSNLPDHDKLKEMLGFTRSAVPHRLTWELTDPFLHDFFWLRVAKPAKGQSIDATLKDNGLEIKTRAVKQLEVGLDSRLISFDKPVRVTLNGDTRDITAHPSMATLCQTLLERGDPSLAFTCRLILNGDKQAAAEDYVPPRNYLCYRAQGPITVDGRLDENAWQAVPWTEDFVDIEGDRRPKPRFKTQAKMLWDDHYFYIAAQLQEPHVWGTLTEHDSVIFQDNDFEVFIDPAGSNHNYAEFEMNALNTGWDLLLKKPYRDGGPAENSWEIPGLKTAVHVEGTLNNPRDIDKGWSLEIAIPWQVLGQLSKQPAPPRDGDQWRVNFSRVEWRHEIVAGKYRKIPKTHEDNWVWCPQGVIDLHRPEKWGYVQFVTAPPGKGIFRPDVAGPAKHLLQRIYYAQRKFHDEHNLYAQSLAELGLAGIGDKTLIGQPRIEANAKGYNAIVDVRQENSKSKSWRIRQDSLIEGVESAP